LPNISPRDALNEKSKGHVDFMQHVNEQADAKKMLAQHQLERDAAISHNDTRIPYLPGQDHKALTSQIRNIVGDPVENASKGMNDHLLPWSPYKAVGKGMGAVTKESSATYGAIGGGLIGALAGLGKYHLSKDKKKTLAGHLLGGAAVGTGAGVVIGAGVDGLSRKSPLQYAENKPAPPDVNRRGILVDPDFGPPPDPVPAITSKKNFGPNGVPWIEGNARWDREATKDQKSRWTERILNRMIPGTDKTLLDYMKGRNALSYQNSRFQALRQNPGQDERDVLEGLPQSTQLQALKLKRDEISRIRSNYETAEEAAYPLYRQTYADELRRENLKLEDLDPSEALVEEPKEIFDNRLSTYNKLQHITDSFDAERGVMDYLLPFVPYGPKAKPAAGIKRSSAVTNIATGAGGLLGGLAGTVAGTGTGALAGLLKYLATRDKKKTLAGHMGGGAGIGAGIGMLGGAGLGAVGSNAAAHQAEEALKGLTLGEHSK